MAKVTATTDQYWAHQPPQVRALRSMDQNAPERGDLAFQLAKQGFLIDKVIMVWGWDAITIMGWRVDEGYTWIPSALMPPIIAGPGIEFPGAPAYDPDHPPKGAIKVSVDGADYPAFDPPPPPPAPPDQNEVGRLIFGRYYEVNTAGLAVPDGEKTTQGGHSYLKHISNTLMGVWQAWELLAA